MGASLQPAAVRIETAAGSIEMASLGEGPAVLALHGGMGGYDQGLILARALFGEAGGVRALAVSRPGYLGTPLTSGAAPEAQADLYAALLDSLGIARCLVAAVSGGGPSAVQFAARHPTRCAGLILVSACTGPLPMPPQLSKRLPMLRLLARTPWLLALMRRGSARDPDRAARRAIPDPQLRAATLKHPEAGPLLQAIQSDVLTRLGERLPGTLNDVERFATLAPLPFAQVTAPVLAVHGTRDPVVDFEHGERVGGETHAELLRIEDGGHVALFTHLDLVRERVRRFSRSFLISAPPATGRKA
jgi:pimeloyl-ACP methyl ester carboxylesterase